MGNLMSCVLICGAMEVVQVVNTNGRVERLIRPIRAAELIWAHESYRAAALAAAAALHSNPALPPPHPRLIGEDKSCNVTNTNNSSDRQPDPKFVLLPLDPSSAAEQRGSCSEGDSRSYTFQCHSKHNVSVARQQQQLPRNSSSKQQQHLAKNSASPKQQHRSVMNAAPPAPSNPTPTPAPPPGRGAAANHAPFRVKKEGGVTTLVVSKRYLEQLLADKEMKVADAVAAADILQDHNYLPSKSSSGGATRHSRRSNRSSSSSSSSSSASGRSGVWRPALESISESQSGSHHGGDQIVPGGHSHRHHHHHHYHHHHKQVKV